MTYVIINFHIVKFGYYRPISIIILTLEGLKHPTTAQRLLYTTKKRLLYKIRIYEVIITILSDNDDDYDDAKNSQFSQNRIFRTSETRSAEYKHETTAK